MVDVFMALLSFRGFDTPSLPAQGEQRRSSISTSAGTSPIFSCFVIVHVISPIDSVSALARVASAASSAHRSLRSGVLLCPKPV
jgi:hypothetical protein